MGLNEFPLDELVLNLEAGAVVLERDGMKDFPVMLRAAARTIEAETALADDLMNVLAHMVVGWESVIGADLAQHPEVLRVAERHRAMRGRSEVSQ